MPPQSYSASAKLMHWFVAASVVALLCEGPVAKRLVPEGAAGESLYDFHEALGALALLAAQHAHYLLLFVMTLLGWAGTHAYGDPVSVFWLFQFPTIQAKRLPASQESAQYAQIQGIGILVAKIKRKSARPAARTAALASC